MLWLPAPGPHGALTSRRGWTAPAIVVQTGTGVGAPDRVRLTVPHRPEHVDRFLRSLDAASG